MWHKEEEKGGKRIPEMSQQMHLATLMTKAKCVMSITSI